MIRMKLSEMAGLLGVEVLHPTASDAADSAIRGVVADSRQVTPDCLFAALPGERVDGHDFAAQALASGAGALLLQRRLELPVPQLVVDDVLVALGLLARGWREKLQPLVVAITGSNGKTTVKEMVASILSRRGATLATEGNYNNELGLPLTLFRLEPGQRYAVLELGASQPGDIRYLAGICRPDLGLVNNVGPAHLEGMGDLNGVASTKGELYQALDETGIAVINGDEPWAESWRSTCKAGQTVVYGRDIHHAVNGELVPRDAGQRDRAVINTSLGQFTAELPLPGEHNLMNALAATAIAVSLDVPLADIVAGLAATQPVAGRLTSWRAPGGWLLIDDTYNANPASLYAGLQVLTRQPGEAWLVLGDMAELGSQSAKMHAEMGDAARSLGVRRLYCVGPQTAHAARAFGEGALHFDDREALLEQLLDDIHAGIDCLVKGSRSSGMERVIAALVDGDQHRQQEAG